VKMWDKFKKLLAKKKKPVKIYPYDLFKKLKHNSKRKLIRIIVQKTILENIEKEKRK